MFWTDYTNAPAVAVTITAYATKDFLFDVPDNNAELFINITMVIAALMELLMATLRASWNSHRRIRGPPPVCQESLQQILQSFAVQTSSPARAH